MRCSQVAQRTRDLAQANKQLSQLATTDALTGLDNRRAFDLALNKEVFRAKRKNLELSLLVLDVDNFKLYNDTYGHEKGDECLKKIASILKSMVQRSSDTVARYGGEEFGVILFDTDPKGALILAQSILNAIESEHIQHEKSPHEVVTVSIGVASMGTKKQVNESDIFNTADKAMYKAKQLGRNTIVQNICNQTD